MHFFFPQTAGEEALQQLNNKKVLTPFAEVALHFIQALSKRFVKMRQHPEIVALGYWMRKAHIYELQQAWEQETNNRIVRGRGTVFHIAPSNVDTIFVYSWVLSLLAGNHNIIRLSSKEQSQLNILLRTILEELENPEFQAIAARNVVLTYSHQTEITARLSMLCHTRVVWGGDATVHAIRQIPLAPMANEIVFADRFSIAMLNAESVNGLAEKELLQLAEQFYNDSFWFDQMACSSPKLIAWTGVNEAVEQAQAQFWKQLKQVILTKQYELAPATQVQKLTTGLWLAAESETLKVEREDAYSRIQLDRLNIDFRERHCGGGFFYEAVFRRAVEVANIVEDKDQTITYFGYSKAELMELMNEVYTRGIDRIVPIGQALNFQTVWDGQSFLRSFTREVVII